MADELAKKMRSEQTNELTAALSKAQGVMENAPMNKTNPHFKSKYADLAAVVDSVRDPLSKNGLAITQTMEIREGGIVLITTLWHTSGQWIASEYPLPFAARPHEMGTLLTYARRYSLAAMVCNSADEDDDVASAEKAPRSAAFNANPKWSEHVQSQQRVPGPSDSATAAIRESEDRRKAKAAQNRVAGRFGRRTMA